MNPASRSDSASFVARDAALAHAMNAAADYLRGLGVRPAPAAREEDVATVEALDALILRTTRVARHTAGSVRAYASLISDGYGGESNAGRWAAKVTRSADEMDEFAVRLGTLRLCSGEQPTETAWSDVLARVAARCGDAGPCTIEVVDRTAGPFRQRWEFLGRLLFHLVRNAVEATPRRGNVLIRADEVRVGGARAVHVRMRDAGAGMGETGEFDAHWRPFVSKKPGHAGLGLAYVAACAPRLGVVAGARSDAGGCTAHCIVFEEGDLSW